jgi:hypothetical protein
MDLLHGARQEVPRMFRNRTDVAAGSPFRDVTGASFEAGYSTGTGHYEECFADFDGDDDLDIYGVNWRVTSSQYTDVVLRNDGAGFFGQRFDVPLSGSDDEDADPIDYDLDGDLDLLIANFSGQERIVRNDGSWTFSATTGLLPPTPRSPSTPTRPTWTATAIRTCSWRTASTSPSGTCRT